jgi:Delta7-sterol 5-desaturase
VLAAIAQFLDSGSMILVFVLTCGFFLAMYLGFAGGAWLLSRRMLPAMGIGRVVDTRALREGQLGREIRGSMVSIVVFGVLTVIQVDLYWLGWIGLLWNATVETILWQSVGLVIWNEVHFYACHRLLHTRWLYRHVHRRHHESVVPTPFATYSFHWGESAMLGSVLLLATIVYDFHPAALGTLPVVSLLFNTIGHWNYDIFSGKIRSASVEHSRHHRLVGGNYGFYLPLLDRWLGTEIRR